MGSAKMPIMPAQQTDHLCNLSPDLKLAIFTRLYSLDDYFRMAKTSKEMCAFLWSNKIFVIRGIIVSIGQAEETNLLTLLHIGQLTHSFTRSDPSYRDEACQHLDLDLVDLEV